MDDRWLSMKEISEISRRPPGDRFTAGLETKGMPGHRIGRSWKFKKDEVDAGAKAVKATE